MNKKLKFFLEGIIAFGIIIFLISQLNVGEVLQILRGTNLVLFTLAIVLFFLNFLLTTFGVKILFDSIASVPFKEWVTYSLCSFSAGLVVPGRAGDLSIIYLAKKRGFDYGASIALTFIDKISTLIIFGVIASIGTFTILNSMELYLGLFVGGVFIVMGLFLLSPIGRKIIKHFIGKYAFYFRGFNKTVHELVTHHRKKLLLNVFITIIRPLISGLVTVLLFKAIGIDAPFFFAIIISSITIIVSLIPFTPNGIGIKEGIGIYLFTLLGISAEAAAGMYALTFAISVSLGLIGMMLYVRERKRFN